MFLCDIMMITQTIKNDNAWILTISIIISLFLIILKYQIINEFLDKNLVNVFIIILAFYLLIATLSLLSFTYLQLFKKAKVDPHDKSFRNIAREQFTMNNSDSYSSLNTIIKPTKKTISESTINFKELIDGTKSGFKTSITYLGNTMIKPEVFGESNLDMEELGTKSTSGTINEFTSNTSNLVSDKEIKEKEYLWNYKLILEGGEYFFISTIFLTIGFFVMAINFGLNKLFIQINIYFVTIFLVILSTIIFLRALINILIVLLKSITLR